MKSIQLSLAAIFFMTYFDRARGTFPLGPPGSATASLDASIEANVDTWCEWCN